MGIIIMIRVYRESLILVIQYCTNNTINILANIVYLPTDKCLSGY